MNSWISKAHCVDLEYEFIGHTNEHNTTVECELCRLAKEICQTCPVRQQCLDEALEQGYHSQAGIRGGYTELERRKMVS